MREKLSRVHDATVVQTVSADGNVSETEQELIHKIDVLIKQLEA